MFFRLSRLWLFAEGLIPDVEAGDDDMNENPGGDPVGLVPIPLGGEFRTPAVFASYHQWYCFAFWMGTPVFMLGLGSVIVSNLCKSSKTLYDRLPCKGQLVLNCGSLPQNKLITTVGL